MTKDRGAPPSVAARCAAWILPPLIGLFAFALPSVVAPPARVYEAPLFPRLRTAVESAGIATVAALLVAGALLGLLFDRRPLALGMLAIAVLPAAAVVELATDATSHNLIPLELASYGLYGCVAAFGAAVARRIRGRR